MHNRTGLDALDSAEQSLRCIQDFVSGHNDMCHISGGALYYLLDLIVQELEEARVKLSPG